MTLNKLTTILVVEEIESALPSLEKLGYRVTVRVPEQGTLGFVIAVSATGELMLQTRASLAEDLPDVAKLRPAHLLYGEVESVSSAKDELPDARVIVPRRETFYGAIEAWLELPGGQILGLSEHKS